MALFVLEQTALKIALQLRYNIYMKNMKDYRYHYALIGKLKMSFAQQHIVDCMIGCALFVYNRMVAINEELYMLRQVKTYLKPVADRMVRLESVRKSAKTLKNSAPFLSEVDDGVIQNAIRNYNKAWANYRKGIAGKPTLHHKKHSGSCQVNPHYKTGATGMNDCSGVYFVDRKHMMLPGLRKVKVLFSPELIKKILARKTETRIGTVTIERDACGEYWVSVLFGSDEPFVEPYRKTNSTVGIDLNLTNFLTDSDGGVVDNPKFFKTAEDKLAEEQRVLSRRGEAAKKRNVSLAEAKNYQKQRVKKAKLERNIKKRREDFHRKTAKHYVESQDIIVFEDLKVANLLGNHKLAKAISDVGWSSFVTICQQTAEMHGHAVIKIPPEYTTQKCSACGHVSPDKIRLGVEAWDCPYCGAHHARDHNAAINILYKGLALCGTQQP